MKICYATVAAGVLWLAGCTSRSDSAEVQSNPATSSVSVKIKQTNQSIPKISSAVMTNRIVKTDDEWRSQLTPEQYRITRQKGTERAFTGAYWNNHEPGTYKCVCCGQELFGSDTKFDSGTGWPSFWKPISQEKVRSQEDNSFFMRRTEVVCGRCDAHLGHVFEDGPKPSGLRYCINSAALNFQKKEPEK